MQSAKQTKLADVHLIKKRGREKIAVVSLDNMSSFSTRPTNTSRRI